MERLTSIRYEEIIRKLKKLGFRFYRSGRGSHELWVRDSDGKVLPVPKHKGRDMKKGTLKASDDTRIGYFYRRVIDFGYISHLLQYSILNRGKPSVPGFVQSEFE